MSPFSQLTSFNTGYGTGIDRDFSPVLHYLDEFDRHFSRRHRFVNCFIPRFDLEEDSKNYYLYGDIPGASVEDITVEARDNHTLVIYGKTNRVGPEPQAQGDIGGGEEAGFVKVNIEDREKDMGDEKGDEITLAPSATPTFPPPPTQETLPNPPAVAIHPQGTAIHGHAHHQRRGTATMPTPAMPSHTVLLSERLVGDVHRTFAFPAAVEEQGIQASMENGVLSLVVPKKNQDAREKERGRRIPILHGKWWQGQERGSGFKFASGAV
jgi:HSP20 family protein